jgi:hypothetical protein
LRSMLGNPMLSFLCMGCLLRSLKLCPPTSPEIRDIQNYTLTESDEKREPFTILIRYYVMFPRRRYFKFLREENRPLWLQKLYLPDGSRKTTNVNIEDPVSFVRTCQVIHGTKSYGGNRLANKFYETQGTRAVSRSGGQICKVSSEHRVRSQRKSRD